MTFLFVAALVLLGASMFAAVASERQEDWSKGLVVITGIGFLFLFVYLDSIVDLLEGLQP